MCRASQEPTPLPARQNQRRVGSKEGPKVGDRRVGRKVVITDADQPGARRRADGSGARVATLPSHPKVRRSPCQPSVTGEPVGIRAAQPSWSSPVSGPRNHARSGPLFGQHVSRGERQRIGKVQHALNPAGWRLHVLEDRAVRQRHDAKVHTRVTEKGELGRGGRLRVGAQERDHGQPESCKDERGERDGTTQAPAAWIIRGEVARGGADHHDFGAPSNARVPGPTPAARNVGARAARAATTIKRAIHPGVYWPPRSAQRP